MSTVELRAGLAWLLCFLYPAIAASLAMYVGGAKLALAGGLAGLGLAVYQLAIYDKRPGG